MDDKRGTALSFTILSITGAHQNEQAPELLKQTFPPKPFEGEGSEHKTLLQLSL